VAAESQRARRPVPRGGVRGGEGSRRGEAAAPGEEQARRGRRRRGGAGRRGGERERLEFGAVGGVYCKSALRGAFHKTTRFSFFFLLCVEINFSWRFSV